MKHTYNFRLVCRCPNDKSVNIYDVEFTTENQIQVEEFNIEQSSKSIKLRDYYIDKTAVTQKAFQNVMGPTKFFFKGS